MKIVRIKDKKRKIVRKIIEKMIKDGIEEHGDEYREVKDGN